MLPLMDLFEQRPLPRRPRHVPAELVRIFELFEELHRILHAIDAELERVDIPGA
jgi:hypothetical protein